MRNSVYPPTHSETNVPNTSTERVEKEVEMRTLQHCNQFKLSLTNILIAFSLIIVFGCSHRLLAQQKDGDSTTATTTENASAPSRPTVNFNILTLLSGEYLEMFGAGSSRGILQGNTTTGGAELGTTTAHPLMFSTNSVERMRISRPSRYRHHQSTRCSDSMVGEDAG